MLDSAISTLCSTLAEMILVGGRPGKLTKSLVVPQNPCQLVLFSIVPEAVTQLLMSRTKSEQQTLRGHFDLVAHSEPKPGSHSAFESHPETQTSLPQKSGPNPQYPAFELDAMSTLAGATT